MTDAERQVFVQWLDPDRVGEYVDAHDDVPDAVTETMAEAGVERFELFVQDDLAVCLIETDDPERYERVYGEAMETDAEVAAWEERVDAFKASGIADTEGIPFAERVWSFEPE